jgi:O-antigen ligase
MLETPSFRILPKLWQYASGENRWTLFLLALIGATVLVVPSLSLVPFLGPYNEKRVLQVGLLLVVGGVLAVSSTTRRQWLSVFFRLPRLARWGLGVVLGLGLLSATLAPAPGPALLEVAHFGLLFATAGVVATAVRRRAEVAQHVLLSVVTASVFLYNVYFAARYGAFLVLPGLEIGRDTVSGFGNVRHFNQYQTWTLPLLGVPFSRLPRRWKLVQGLVFGLLALWWSLLFASVVRGALLALLVAFVTVAFLFQRRAVRSLLVQGAALLVGLGLYYLLFRMGSGGGGATVVGKVQDTRSYVGRLEHWQICLEMVGAHPWLGAGPMHYAWPPINFLPAAHPHNTFMQWLGEWGIPSTAIMSGLTVWGGWQWMQQEKTGTAGSSDDPAALRVALVSSVLAGAAYAMISGVLVMPVSQLLLVLVGGWAWGRYRFEEQQSPVPSTFAHFLLGGLLVAAGAIVGRRSTQDLSTAEERQSAFAEAVDRRHYSPRYWMQGYIQVRDSSVVERARRQQ